MRGVPAATDVDEWLSRLAPEPRAALEKLRAQIRAAAPGAQEKISYGQPTFMLHGHLVAFGAFNIPGGDYKRVVNGQETTRHYEPRSLFLFEAFKLVDGKIEQIEATMRNVPLGAKSGW